MELQDMKVIMSDQITTLFDTNEPAGLFLYEQGDSFIGVDKRTGTAWLFPITPYNIKYFNIIKGGYNMTNDIKVITKEEGLNIIDTFEPKGLFLYEIDDKFVGIDNSTGEVWVEEFKTKEHCVYWLFRKEDID